MNTHLPILLLTLTLTITILAPSTDAAPGGIAKRRPPPPIFPLNSNNHPHHNMKRQKKLKSSSRLSSLFGKRNKRRKGRRGKHLRGGGGSSGGEMMSTEESRNSLYYYSLHGGTTQRPRIILGDSLNFENLGILNEPQQQNQKNTKSIRHQELIEHELNDYQYTNIHDDDGDNYRHSHVQSPAQQQRPRRPVSLSGPPLPGGGPRRRRIPKSKRIITRGPGYRIRENASWQDHYVLEHELTRPNNKKRPQHPKVMTSMMRAAGELRNAYKAAVIQSAKVAKYTGSAVGKYFQGVRNIFGGVGGDDGYNRKSSEGGVSGKTPASSSSSNVGSSLLLPTNNKQQQKQKNAINKDEPVDEVVIELNRDDLREDDGPPQPPPQSKLSQPNIYLDWGGSFWKYFYNKSGSGGKGNKRIGGTGVSLSEIEANQGVKKH